MYHTTGLYIVARAVLDATPPDAGYGALHLPADDAMCLVSVFCWNSITAQHAWEERTDVIHLLPEDHGKPAHATLVTGFGKSHGVTAGMSQRRALRNIRATWPGLHI